MYDLKSIQERINQLIEEREQALKEIWTTSALPLLRTKDLADAIHKLYEPELSRLNLAFNVAEWHMVNQKTSSQMISVAERMPEEGQQVLILCRNTFIHCVFECGEFLQVFPFYNGTPYHVWENITHWMPLPSIPSPVSNAN